MNILARASRVVVFPPLVVLTGCATAEVDPRATTYVVELGTVDGAGCKWPVDPEGRSVASTRSYAIGEHTVGDSFTSASDCVCTAKGIACAIDPATIACTHNRVAYKLGDSFPSGDGCNTCRCGAHGIACTETVCAPGGCIDNGKIYEFGESFEAACNRCFCLGDGSFSCMCDGSQPGCSGATCGRCEYLRMGERYWIDSCQVCSCQSSLELACTGACP